MGERNIYKQFDEFLTEFLIRRAEGTLTDNDFDEKQSDCIRPHLENILPTLTLPEVIRIQTYFNEALNFHIKEALGQQKPLGSSSAVASYNTEVQPFKRPKPVEADTQKESSQEETPHEGFTFTQRETAGMMQSTPLSMPIATENQMKIHVDQPEYTVEDPFLNDIISHINLSPIPQEFENQPILSNPNVNTYIQSDPNSNRNIEFQEHPFLRNFVQLMETANRKEIYVKEKTTSQQNNAAKTELPTSKAKGKKIPFLTLCCWRPKKINQETEESFLYFSLLPRKMRNLIKNVTGSVRTGKDQSNIPMEKIMNLSNVMRAYASEKQWSVELPVQGSFLPSPCTPENLLRSSQIQPFTPIRGDVSSQLFGIETEQIYFQTRSVIRQQPLLTIPERDSLIHKPIESLDEDAFSFRNALSSIEQLPENVLRNQLDIQEENINLTLISENVEQMNLEFQPSIHTGSPNMLPQVMGQHELSLQNENIVQNNTPPPIENQGDDAQSNWFDILRPRLDVLYPIVEGEKRKKKSKKRKIKPNTTSRPNIHQDTPAPNSTALPTIPDDISEQITQYPVLSNLTQLEHELRAYINLLKKGVKNSERTWEHFDPFLFSENDDFEMYTHIFKRIIKEDFVSMGTLYKEGTSRMDAARGFRLLLELQTMGLIEIIANGTRIESFKYKYPNKVFERFN